MGQQGTGAPPGWYRDPGGALRWWDGQMWGAFAPVYDGPPPPNKTMAVLAHLGPILGGFILPLIVYLTADKRDVYVRHHASEGLNFQLTFLIVWFAGAILFFVGFGVTAAAAGSGGGGAAFGLGWFFFIWLVLFGLGIASWVFAVIGAIAASQGKWYRYPIAIRFVKGAVDPDTPRIYL
jgi:uncharacterized protein